LFWHYRTSPEFKTPNKLVCIKLKYLKTNSAHLHYPCLKGSAFSKGWKKKTRAIKRSSHHYSISRENYNLMLEEFLQQRECKRTIESVSDMQSTTRNKCIVMVAEMERQTYQFKRKL